VGGDAPDADGLGGMLLGAGVKLATRVTRTGTETVEQTVDFGPVYKGRVVVLVNGQTASEPEMLTAALKEYGRVTVVGERTRGAFNGFTEGMPLPEKAGILVVPIDRGVSPQGKEYEGIGVTPDVTVQNSIRDFRAGRDRAMETALRLAAH
jgi:carboxyl-terminal processing protease